MFFFHRIIFAPTEGKFDLMISNITYERDNGQFECWVKAGGSGRTMHSQGYNLVVLSQPKPPVLNTGPLALAQEGRQLNLTCSSSGGSPSPVIKWVSFKYFYFIRFLFLWICFDTF